MRQSTEFRHNTLGNGLVHPFRRVASSDFASAEGEALVRSSISQIIGTKFGELPWRPEFGVDLESFRNKNAVQALAGTIASQITEALQTWDQRITVLGVETSIDSSDPFADYSLRNKIVCKISWVVVTDAASEANNVLIGPVSQEVAL